jgi:uncharacterized membrane protein YdbT with pleckstrin-like domain
MIENELVLRPTVRKTLVKGLIAIALFSILLQIRASNLANYMIFVLISFTLAAAYAAMKRSNRYIVSEEGITIKTLFRAPRVISYSDIADLSLSQGTLAKRFNCGSVFILLKGHPDLILMNRNSVTVLRDVENPSRVFDTIASRLGPM